MPNHILVAGLAMSLVASAPSFGLDQNPHGLWFENSAQPGHSLKILPVGTQVTQTRFEMIERARGTIYLSTYGLKADTLSLQIAYQLCEKAKQGVDVRLLLDNYGSRPFKRYIESLRSCGARVIVFNPPHWNVFKAMYAMHEKLLMVDGRELLMGGSNFGTTYHDAARDAPKWHDLDVKIDGPAACWYHKTFVETWKRSARRERASSDYGPFGGGPSQDHREYLYGLGSLRDCVPVTAGNSKVLPLYGNPLLTKKRPIIEAYESAILATRNEIRLYAPYFVPGKRFQNALIRARHRGVDVTVITNSPESNDEKDTLNIGMFFAVKKLLKAGVKIQMWDRKNTMHRKGGLYDGRWAYFGSDNLDNRGQEYSSESVAFTDDEEIVKQLSTEIDEDLRHTRELTLEYVYGYLEKKSGWARRIALWIIRYL